MIYIPNDRKYFKNANIVGVFSQHYYILFTSYPKNLLYETPRVYVIETVSQHERLGD